MPLHEPLKKAFEKYKPPGLFSEFYGNSSYTTTWEIGISA